MSRVDELDDRAAEWHVRMLGATGPEDLETFCAWLEASPEHAAAYERLMLVDADLEGRLEVVSAPAIEASFLQLEPPISANDNDARWDRRRRFAGWTAMATGIAASALFLVGRPAETPPTTIATRMGQQETTRLPDGSVVHLNGGTKVIVAGVGRAVQLVSGEATFAVRHNEAHPFSVAVDDFELRDVGTTFNVRRDADGFELTVAEGSVAFDPSGRNLVLEAGSGLSVRRGEVREFAVNAEQVGGWERRRLSYDSAPLPKIAADLTRLLGVSITVSPDTAGRKYTGTIAVPRDWDAAIRAVSLILDLKANRTSRGIMLSR